LIEPAIPFKEDPNRMKLKELAGDHSLPTVSYIYFLEEETKKAFQMSDVVDTRNRTLVIPPHILPSGLFNVKVFINATHTGESVIIFIF